MQAIANSTIASPWMKLILFAALFVAAFAIAACGSSAEPADGAPTAATEDTVSSQATEPTESEDTESAATTADVQEPQGEVAHKFELPNAKGGTVSLASFAGDKNVVLVFYRGFW